MRLLFGLRVPEDACFVEVRPVFTGSSRPRLIFRGPLQKRGVALDENDIADALSQDVKFWRWIHSEERARRLWTERNGRVVRFRLALTFFNAESALIILDASTGRASLVTAQYETFDNETFVGRFRR